MWGFKSPSGQKSESARKRRARFFYWPRGGLEPPWHARPGSKLRLAVAYAEMQVHRGEHDVARRLYPILHLPGSRSGPRESRAWPSPGVRVFFMRTPDRAPVAADDTRYDQSLPLTEAVVLFKACLDCRDLDDPQLRNGACLRIVPSGTCVDRCVGRTHHPLAGLEPPDNTTRR